ncbi:asparagine synthase-related protein [Paenibacillus protaetiae]|uniref:asparagine synthase (glutamine-hydrolyzing) n=1 Tax=Paenibacillus protaetiae TaxID=2509456 RepID=A0A4V0YF80_9BACL|nr:asparagine synthase-related protein [Paenibacillus protaetiae]QAY66781.1 asparagine synthetase B [Paenibacillus protaetiae]
MSAISGILCKNGADVPEENVALIMNAMRIIPADNTAKWHNNPIFLGCHTQWITLQSIHEILPYYDNVRRLAITSDAIIDNRSELFEKLQVPLFIRDTMTDSELLLLAYEHWGSMMVPHLVGDFAFMIWDENRQHLFGARDFSGARTLYYHQDHNFFSFCTLIKPLLELPYVEKKLNEQWLAEYLSVKSWIDQPNQSNSVYQNIMQLPPSHTITVSFDQIHIQKYDSLANIKPLKLSSSEEYEEAFREVFQNAVTARFRTNRAIGSHLSGGLDSGSVASFAAHALQKEQRQLHTFSYVPTDSFVDWTAKHRIADERPLILETIRYAGNMNAHFLDFSDSNPYSEIDVLLNVLESPYKFFENSFWLKGIYEEANKLNIGVLLNGFRGNHSISWGSARPYYAKLLRHLKWYKFAKEVKFYSHNTGISRTRLYKAIGKQAFPFFHFNTSASPEFPPLINEEFAKSKGLSAVDSLEIAWPNDMEKARHQHFKHVHTWSSTGMSSCKLSLQYSLRTHDPTNDLRVIRFCLSLPMEQYIQQGMDRALVRRSTKNVLPDSIRLNQRTRGIQAADSLHRMTKEWKTFISELDQMSLDPRMNQYLNMAVIKNEINKARNGLSSDQAYSITIKLLMRSLIVYRFANQF